MVKDYKKMYEGYDSERDILGRAGGDYGHRLADLITFEKEIEALEKENELEKMALFVKLSDDMRLNPDKLLDNRLEKSKLIRDYKGYSTVKFSDYQIGVIFKGLYNSAIKK